MRHAAICRVDFDLSSQTFGCDIVQIPICDRIHLSREWLVEVEFGAIENTCPSKLTADDHEFVAQGKLER